MAFNNQRVKLTVAVLYSPVICAFNVSVFTPKESINVMKRQFLG